MKNKNYLHSLVKFMFNAKVALAEVTLADGSLIEINEDTMVASYINQDGTLTPMGEGTWDLMDGNKLVVDSESKVVPQLDSTEVASDVVAEEVKQESVSEFTSQIETFANKNMVLENEKLALQEQLNEQTEKFNKISQELEDLKKTSIEKFKSVEKTMVDKPLSRKDIILNDLKNKLNK